MPSSPEFTDGLREKRLIEVPGNLNAKQCPAAPHDVHASGKIRINLQCIDEHRQDHNAAAVIRRTAENGTDKQRRPVSQHHFLEKSPEDQLRAKGKLPVISPVSFKGLPCKLAVTADRAFRNIGEKAEEKCQSAEVMIRRCLPPVNIDHIAHR